MESSIGATESDESGTIGLSVGPLYTRDSRGRVREFIVEANEYDSAVEGSTIAEPVGQDGNRFPFVVAIIPAYNEQESIGHTIGSLRDQTRRPDEIIVVADNCTDATIEICLASGVSVVESRNNEMGKAGALNALLAEILPILDADDVILVMDADSELTERFIESTVTTLFSDSKRVIAGVGGIFLENDEPRNLVRQLQANEYTRYRRRLGRRHGRALVLTGTGSVFRAGILREIQHARASGTLPDRGETLGVYDTSALTEDNELTISAKELGYRVISPKDCTVKTAMMPNLSSLYKQRRRWQRGAIENLLAHGLTRHTAPYFLRQLLTYTGVLFLPFYLWTLTVALTQHSTINFVEPLWLGVAALYIIEQTFSVRKGGGRAVLVSIAVIPELFLTVFLNVVYVMCFAGTLFATNETWGRMRHLNAEDATTKPRARPTGPDEPLSLHGTHRSRHTRAARMLQMILAILILMLPIAAALLPLLSLSIAWSVLAVYVLLGAVATLGRLIPVPTA
jgi:cellulose synthase/poly-beta-1,6-N-acetylglucosamine synthase-like glycosyltransferase